jgi:hypothetical protein
VFAPTSPAEVLDRLTILDLKVERIPDPSRRAIAERHRQALVVAWEDARLPAPHSLEEYEGLVRVNTRLWDVEDALRDHEARGQFDEAFVALARSVYRLNDHRAALKSALDQRLGANFRDVKGYSAP